MLFKKSPLLQTLVPLLALIFTTIHMQAQPTYPASAYADPGDVHTVTTVGAGQLSWHYFKILKEGANKTWDFTLMQGALQKKRKFYDPSLALDYAAAYIALCTQSCMAICPDQCEADGDTCRSQCSGPLSAFCIAGCNAQEAICKNACPVTCGAQCVGNTTKWDLAEARFDDIDFSPIVPFVIEDNYNIMEIGNTMTTWTMAGRLKTTLVPIPNLGAPILIPYTDPDKKLEFPVQYSTSFSDLSSYQFDLGLFANVVPLVNQFKFKVDQQRTTEVVGYGTIKTPHGTYNNALKVRTTLEREYTVWLNGIKVATSAFPGVLRPDNLVEYMWFDASEEIPVFRVFGTEKWGVESFTHAEYLDDPINWPFKASDQQPLPTAADYQFEVTAYPNPVMDRLTVTFVSPIDDEAILEIYNPVGQLVLSRTQAVRTMERVSIDLALDNARLPGGVYMAVVRIGEQHREQVTVNKF